MQELARTQAPALPLGGVEASQQHQRLAATLRERRERFARVVAPVLALVGPPVGIERVPDRAADPPRRQVGGRRVEREDLWLVHREHRHEPREEELLHVAQVADDLRRGPVVGVGPAGQRAVIALAHGRRELIERHRQTP